MWYILLVHSDKTTLKLAHLLHLHVRNLRLTELRCLAQRTPSWRVPRSLMPKLVLPVVSHCLSRHCVHGIWLGWPDLVSIWQLNTWANLSSRCLVGTMSDALNISQAHCYNLKREIGALLLLLLSRFSHVQLCVTPQMAAHQAPLSLGFSRQEYWSGAIAFSIGALSKVHKKGLWISPLHVLPSLFVLFVANHLSVQTINSTGKGHNCDVHPSIPGASNKYLLHEWILSKLSRYNTCYLILFTRIFQQKVLSFLTQHITICVIYS